MSLGKVFKIGNVSFLKSIGFLGVLKAPRKKKIKRKKFPGPNSKKKKNSAFQAIFFPFHGFFIKANVGGHPR